MLRICSVSKDTVNNFNVNFLNVDSLYSLRFPCKLG